VFESEYTEKSDETLPWEPDAGEYGYTSDEDWINANAAALISAQMAFLQSID
jgi:hypothetical protein